MVLLAVLVLSSSLYAARLTARVRNSDGSPAAALTVHITNLDTGEKYDLVTDAAGDLQVDLPGGDFSVEPEGAAVSEKDHALHLVITPDVDQHLELDLVKDLARAWSRLVVRQPAEAAASEGAKAGSDAALTVVRDYDAILTQAPGSAAGRVAPLEDLINPFAAARRGAFHGSLYEFHRNDNLDARNFFDPLGEPLPEYKRNQFGGSLSAALTSQLQLMGSYDGLRIVQGSTLLSHVPTKAMKVGDFGELLQAQAPIVLRDPITGEPWPDNRIAPGRISPVSAKLLGLLPDPNRADPDRNFVNNQPLVHDQSTVTLKLDYQYAGAKISTDYHVRDSQATRPHPLPSFGTTENARGQDVSVGLNYSLTRRLLLDLRFSFIRNLADRYSQNAGRAGLLEST
ncbi:MAG: carboxypeptidase regulatory-like domain-containing protein, partial [Acidobacteria bacterium]